MNQPVARFTVILGDVWSIHPAVSRRAFRARGSYSPGRKIAPRNSAVEKFLLQTRRRGSSIIVEISRPFERNAVIT